MVKRKRPKEHGSKKPEKRNLTFILFAVVIFVGSILGYALLSGGSLGLGGGEGEAGEPPTERRFAEQMSNPYVVDEAFVEKGKAIYQERCLSCHLADGSGPEYHSILVHGQHHSQGDYFWITTYGIPGSIMKGQQKELTIEERWQVVAYVRRELAGVRE